MARIKSNTRVVCDAGPIIHLDEIGRLDLIEDFNEVLVPNVVFQEVSRYRPMAFKNARVKWSKISYVLPVEEPLRTMCNIFALDAGERAALSCLMKEPDLMFLTDDAAARVVAVNLGLNVHGTIGVLIRAIRRELMEPKEVVDVLNRLPVDSSLHIKTVLFKEFISRLKQEFDL